MIGKRAHHRTVVVTVIRPAVGLHDRPVSEVRENRVGSILNTVLFLRARAAAKGHVAAADDRVSADIVVSLDNDHGRASVRDFNRRR